MYDTAVCFCHDLPPISFAASASAPPTISRISFVMRLLTNLVICQLQGADQFLGVVGRIAHGDHAGGMFAGLRFENGLVNLQSGKARDDLIQDLVHVRFIIIRRSGPLC
ncbi:MAG: hypothetical protein MZU97_06330 [Bacillus subtilis]|nr:hypothetical protein [Bacillus subtilis]